MYSDRKQISARLGIGAEKAGKEGKRERLKKGMKKFLRMKDMLIILTAVMVSWMYTYAKTYQFIIFKCEFLHVDYYSIKLLKTNQEGKTYTCERLNKI